MALHDEYDVGVLMCTDTDLKPALETVAKMGSDAGGTKPRAEVAAWSADASHNRRLSIPGIKLWCHWLDEGIYRSVADPTDYSQEIE